MSHISDSDRQAIRTVIDQFRTQCDKAEYTDIGECWEVFAYIEQLLETPPRCVTCEMWCPTRV